MFVKVPIDVLVDKQCSCLNTGVMCWHRRVAAFWTNCSCTRADSHWSQSAVNYSSPDGTR